MISGDVRAVLRDLPERLAALDGELARRREPSWAADRDRLAREARALALRLDRADDPLLVVLAGGTGAGKSTLLNSLAGAEVAATGVLRPTTTAPTVAGRAADLAELRASGLLDDLAWVDDAAAEVDRSCLRARAVDGLPPGLLVLDSPDVDSVVTDNRVAAERLLDAADLWAWVAHARGYADEVGMGHLRLAARRGTAALVALTHVEDAHREALRADLRAKLADAGLADAPVEVVPLDEAADGRLPERAVGGLRARLEGLAPPEARRAERERTVAGAAAALPGRLDGLLAEVAADRAAADELAERIDAAYARVGARLERELAEGLPLRQEVLARWGELVGATRLQEHLESATDRLQSWARQAFPRLRRDDPADVEQEAAAEAGAAVAEAVATVLAATEADALAAWRRHDAGRLLAPAEVDDAARRDRVASTVDAWQVAVTDLVATVGASRATRARWLTTGVNATAASAALVLFALSGGLTGGEVALTAGGAATAQYLLAKVLGERNVQWLLGRMRGDLLARVEELAAEEAAALRAPVGSAAPPPEAVAAVAGLRDRLAEAAR